MSNSVHVVYGAPARRAVKAALRSTEPRAQIVALLDALDVGPLRDIDDRAVERRRFWKQVGFEHQDWLRIRRSEARLGKLLRDMPREVVLWRGLTASELLLGYRFAADLARIGCPVFEVVNEHHNPHSPEFSSAIGIQKPKALALLAPNRALVRDLEARATRWEALKRGGSSFRTLKGGAEVVELGEDAHDRLIIQSCGSSWQRMNQAIGRVMSEVMLGDWVVGWRMRALIASGRLEGRGKGVYGPAEVRAVAVDGQS